MARERPTEDAQRPHDDGSGPATEATSTRLRGGVHTPSEADGDMFGGAARQEGQALLARRPKRLMGLLRPEALGISAVVALVMVSGRPRTSSRPKILGQAMDVIFGGVVGKQLPAGVPIEPVRRQACAQQGQDNFADMLARMDLMPGAGIDFQKLAFADRHRAGDVLRAPTSSCGCRATC